MAHTAGLFVQAALALIAALLIGFGVAKLRTENVAAPVLAHRIGPVEMEGRVEFAQAQAAGTDVAGRARLSMAKVRCPAAAASDAGSAARAPA